jgi:hypothetical protein
MGVLRLYIFLGIKMTAQEAKTLSSENCSPKKLDEIFSIIKSAAERGECRAQYIGKLTEEGHKIQLEELGYNVESFMWNNELRLNIFW